MNQPTMLTAVAVLCLIGSVFLQKHEYDARQARIKSLEALVKTLTIERDHARVQYQLLTDTFIGVSDDTAEGIFTKK